MATEATDDAVAVAREAVIGTIAEHAAYHNNGDLLPSHSLRDCPNITPALDELEAAVTVRALRKPLMVMPSLNSQARYVIGEMITAAEAAWAEARRHREGAQ